MKKETQDKLLKIVEQNYEEIAEEFDETRQKRLWPEVVKLTEQVRDGDRVLDVGCGNARLATALINKNIKYTGIDQNQRLINLAQENIKTVNFQFPIPNFQFIIGDILKLSAVTQEKFDHIFCIAVLHHIPGEELRVTALKQMRSCLKPDGKIVLTVWNLWSDKFKLRGLLVKFALLKAIGFNRLDWGDVLFDWKRNQISQRYYHAFRQNGLRRLINRAGLTADKLYHDKYNYYSILRNTR
jgi:ubiquinone/menaquinone biosynthesis C-methylase UbiE